MSIQSFLLKRTDDKIFILVCVLTALLCLSPVALAETQTNWKDKYQSGVSALGSEDPQKAEIFFRSALTLVRKQSKDRESENKCMLKLAETLALLDKTGEASSLYKKVLTRLSNRHGRNSKKVEPLLMALGSIEESLGNHDNAMSYYNRALKINEKNYGNYSPAYASVLHRIARVHNSLGNKKEALKHYKKSISILAKNPNLAAANELQSVLHDYKDLLNGPDQSNKNLITDFNKDIGSPSLKLKPKIKANSTNQDNGNGSNWQKQSKFELKAFRQGETDENQKVAMRGLKIPSSDQTLKPAYKIVSDTVFNQGRYHQSESQYKRKIAIDIDSLGPHHPSVGNDLVALAQLYISQEKFAEAQPLLQKALKIYDSTYGDGNILVVNTRSLLARVEYRLGNYDKALRHYSNALTQGQSAFGPNSIETAKILNDLAYLYFQRGKLKESATVYGWAVSSCEGALGEDSPLLAACLKDYAKVLNSLGKTEKAKEMQLRASSILANVNN